MTRRNWRMLARCGQRLLAVVRVHAPRRMSGSNQPLRAVARPPYGTRPDQSWTPACAGERLLAIYLGPLGLERHQAESGQSRGVSYILPMTSPTPSRPSPTELSEADAPDIARLYGRCADYFLLQDGVPPTLADARELFTDMPLEKSTRDQAVLGWHSGDCLYAIAAILRDYPCGGTWYLGFMIVDAAWRGRGIGRSIYTTIENWAAPRGAPEIRLSVLYANEAGERFWLSLGFNEVRRVGPDTFKERSHRRIELSRGGNCGSATESNQ